MTPPARACALLLLATALGARAQDPAPPAADEARVRVLTFNVWGIPVVTPRREARMARIGPAALALRPDVVCLQEVWADGDMTTLERALACGGLAHAQRFASWPGNSGLLVVSRWPIAGSTFTRYGIGGKPHQVWRGDWWGGKGVGRVRLEGPLGPLDLADTHLHARYGSDEFLAVQVTQALDLVDALGDAGRRAARGGPGVGPADAPLILAGDLNSHPGAPPFEVIAAGAGLASVDRRLGIDHVLVRDGGSVAVRVVSVEPVLEAEVDLGDGATGALSDHHGVLVELALSRRGSAPPAAQPANARAWRTAADVALGVIAAERSASVTRSWIARALLLVAAVATRLLVRRWRRTPPGRARRGLGAAAVAGALVVVGSAYAGLGLEPWLRRGLDAALPKLE